MFWQLGSNLLFVVQNLIDLDIPKSFECELWHAQVIVPGTSKSLNWTCPSHWMWVVTCPSHWTWHIQVIKLDMPKSLKLTFPVHWSWHAQVIEADMPNSLKLMCPIHWSWHAQVIEVDMLQSASLALDCLVLLYRYKVKDSECTACIMDWRHRLCLCHSVLLYT